MLPLANLSGDASQDYYAEGMTVELITALAENRSLRVVSRTSTMQYKGASRPLPQVAQALGVDGILEGSVIRSADHVHMSLQLIYAPSDTHVWAQSYDSDLNGASSLPQELAQTIARAAGVRADRPRRNATSIRRRTMTTCSAVTSGSGEIMSEAGNILRKRFTCNPIMPLPGTASQTGTQ